GLPPGEGLVDAPTRLLERFERVDSDLSWLRHREASAESEIERQLADFVERKLVTERSEGGTKTYRLRFPHHLAVLSPHDQDGDRKLREGIAAFRQVEEKATDLVRAPLSP